MCLGPEECRTRLKSPPTEDYLTVVGRGRFSSGDGTLYLIGSPMLYRSALQMHLRVRVVPAAESAAELRLRFSGGLGSALLLLVIDLVSMYAFGWAIWSAAGGSWSWFAAASLVGILVPILLVLALRSTAARDIGELTGFIAGKVDGTGQGFSR